MLGTDLLRADADLREMELAKELEAVTELPNNLLSSTFSFAPEAL